MTKNWLLSFKHITGYVRTIFSLLLLLLVYHLHIYCSCAYHSELLCASVDWNQIRGNFNYKETIAELL